MMLSSLLVLLVYSLKFLSSMSLAYISAYFCRVFLSLISAEISVLASIVVSDCCVLDVDIGLVCFGFCS